MDSNKKVGTVTMVCSAVAAFAAFALSNGWGGYPDIGFMTRLMEVLYVPLFPCEFSFGQYDYGSWCRVDLFHPEAYFSVPTKYLLVICIALFAVGMLLVRGVLTLPKRNQVREH